MGCSQFYLYRSCERKWFVLLCVRWPLSHARACRDVRTYLNLLNLPEAAWYAVATFIDLRQHWVATCIQALLLLFCLFHIDADTLVTRGYTCTWSRRVGIFGWIKRVMPTLSLLPTSTSFCAINGKSTTVISASNFYSHQKDLPGRTTWKKTWHSIVIVVIGFCTNVHVYIYIPLPLR